MGDEIVKQWFGGIASPAVYDLDWLAEDPLLDVVLEHMLNVPGG